MPLSMNLVWRRGVADGVDINVDVDTVGLTKAREWRRVEQYQF